MLRLNKALSGYDLPKYKIINPNNQCHSLLGNKKHMRVGRLDGVMYYKSTSLNLYNLVKQRRNRKFELIKFIPDNLSLLANKPLNYFLNRHCRKVLKMSDLVVFQSYISQKLHEKFVGEAKNKSKIILNGISIDEFHPLDKCTSLNGNPNLVITASFRLHKRLQDAIHITNLLKSTFPSIKLHVVGKIDGLTSNLLEKINTSNCVFHGELETIDLPILYSCCDVGLSTSLFDSCPNSVIEMVACGLPVLTTIDSGAAEIIKNDDLIIGEGVDMDYIELQTEESIPKVDIKDWADRVVNVLENRSYYSDAMIQRVSEELDIKIVAKKYADFIVENYNAIS